MKKVHAALGAVFLLCLAYGFNNPYARVPPWTALLAWSAVGLAQVWLGARAAGKPWPQDRPGLFFFLLSLTAYLATLRWHGGDDLTNGLLPFAVLRYGTLSMDPFRAWFDQHGLADFIAIHRGHYLGSFPIASGIMALPVYIPTALAGGPILDEQLQHNLSKISAALICAASVALFHRIARMRASARWAAAVTVLYAFGGYTFSVSSQALYQHGPSQLAVLIGLLGLYRDRGASDALLSGLGFGVAVACRPDNALFAAPAALFFLLHRRRRLPQFLAGCALPMAVLACYWVHYTGRLSPPESGIQKNNFDSFHAGRLWAMLASPTRGMLFFTPAAAVFGVWGAVSAWRKRKDPLGLYFLAGCLGTAALFASRYSWSGGNTFGNRYFAVVTMMLTFYCADAEDLVRASSKARAAWSFALAASVLVHALGAFMNWPGSSLLDPQLAAIWDFTLFAPVSLFTSAGALKGLAPALRIATASAILLLTLWSARRTEPAEPA